MKNTSLILIALLSVSVGMSYAQDGKKQEPVKKVETKKVTKRLAKDTKNKKEAPAKKVN